MDLNAEVEHLVKASQAWIPMLMEYGSRVLLAFITLAIGWWLINKLTHKMGRLLAMRNADLALQGFVTKLSNIVLKDYADHQRGLHDRGGNHLVCRRDWWCDPGHWPCAAR